MIPDIINDLSTYITNQIMKQPGKVINPDEKIISSGLIDSFHLVDISIFVEEKYGVLIDDTELNADTFDTLNELAEIIIQRN